ncbi:BTAD domain-containing putative transcriptional regulator [Actinophytocola algeriensis]|uniref:DNA-binding SARP family transcriptional activator/tetratricopeptide (TPR) repeat protein n=1 Tax=Actinophytocola algeriensis TaxID=1768010 RepID=A0A7W7VGM1_9PSEU|nr:BTAD domain-containing putative transcriptional regulator [Actinophytocola algeriensis]MBB4909195.1 DNA-binding SARP family transcriptional activator/tetratricopeptide (TPR) repeat protein [Actinophytocola algeriensis]MBE1474417.1 DNA-binding SARP family transcriptional activator/tetratricopeptide (TPR) repeat protein [Actinophytocola algeriensis]
MRFAILGPVRVLRDGAPVDVGGPKQRALLTVFLTRPGQVLTTDWLADALWDGRPPAGAHVTLRTYVTGLRRALEPGRGRRADSDLLRAHPGGYELHVEPDAIDAVRFDRLTEAAATADPVTAERRYTEALALWHGDPLASAAGLTVLRPDLTRLTEARLAAVDGRHAAAVAAGRHESVLPELHHHVASHPQREAARATLMLALYRAGRQTAALAAYTDGQRLLATEFGVEPGPELRALHRQVLTHTVPLVEPGLFGREAELARLTALLDDANAGRGRVVTIVGEAGIGKTSLASAVRDQARARGVPVVWTRCPDLGRTPPFWLWTQVVRELSTSDQSAALAVFTEGRPAETADPAARFRTYDAVAALVTAAAARAGLVLVLDDLHAADPDSLLLLRYLAPTLATARVLVVVTSRPYDHLPAVVAAVADLVRTPGGTQLRPAGLDAGAVTALVRTATVAPPPPGLVGRLVARTGGNPFFITEVLAADRTGAALPPSVRDAVRAHLDTLPGPARACLDLLAVADRDLAPALFDDPGGLADALAAHLVTEARQGTVRFRHPLFAEVVYAALAPAERAALHARLARWPGLTPAERAHHHDRAGHDEEHLRWTLRAADDATRRLAYEDAVAHLDRAADRLAHLADAKGELEVQLLRMSLLQVTAGIGSDAVVAAATRARALLPQAGSDVDQRPALWALGEIACNHADFAVADDLAARLCAATDSRDHDRTGLVAVGGHYLRGVVAYFTGRLATAESFLDRALALLAAAGPVPPARTPTLTVHHFRALTRSLRGDHAGAEADLAEARAAMDPHGRANAALFAGWVALQEQDADAGRVAGLRCHAVGVEENMPHFVHTGEFFTEWAAARGGDPGRLAAMRAAGAGVYRLGLRSTRTITAAAMADAYLAAGDTATAARLADEALTRSGTTGERVLAAELHRVRGVATRDPADLRTAAGLAAAQGAGLLSERVAADLNRISTTAG